jgi:hypothetical protein
MGSLSLVAASWDRPRPPPVCTQPPQPQGGERPPAQTRGRVAKDVATPPQPLARGTQPRIAIPRRTLPPREIISVLSEQQQTPPRGGNVAVALAWGPNAVNTQVGYLQAPDTSDRSTPAAAAAAAQIQL